MASKTFYDYQPPNVDAAWLNDVDSAVYTVLGGSATANDLRRHLHAVQTSDNSVLDLQIGTHSNRPTAGTLGRLYVTTDSPATLYIDTGTTWLSLNATLLDGQSGSFYQNASNLNAGTLPDARLSNSIITGYNNVFSGDYNTLITPGMYRDNSGTTNRPSTASTYGQMLVIFGGGDTIVQMYFAYQAGGAAWFRSGQGAYSTAGATWHPWYKLWNSGNDGAGSNLDADLLDGQQGAFYQNPIWQITTTALTAVAGDKILADSSGGAFSVTLPASPSPSDTVTVRGVGGTVPTNHITINSNSQPIVGTVQNFIIDKDNFQVDLVYINATRGWEY